MQYATFTVSFAILQNEIPVQTPISERAGLMMTIAGAPPGGATAPGDDSAADRRAECTDVPLCTGGAAAPARWLRRCVKRLYVHVPARLA